MEAPGYAPERESVVEAPDGVLAAFTVTWHDRLNRTGLFEPVGTHKNYRRLGLGLAMMRYAMRQMAAAGMVFATVATFADNEAAGKLYRACGFQIWHYLDGYTKAI